MTAPDSIAFWLLRNHPDDGLTHAEVCNLMGIPAVTLQNWANRGLVKPLTGRGKGERRVYGSHELSRIVIARYLRSIGFGLTSSFFIAREAWRLFCEGLRVLVKVREADLPDEFKRHLLNAELIVSLTQDDVQDIEIQVVDRNNLPLTDTANGPVLRFGFGKAIIDLAMRAIDQSKTGKPEPFPVRLKDMEASLVAAMNSARRGKGGRR